MECGHMKKQLPVIREQVASNWLYKLVSLTVAVSIWATMLHGRKDTILMRNMDLEFILKPNHVISPNVQRSVRVKVSGPRASVKKFSLSVQTIVLNLSMEEPGLKRVEVKASDVNLPSGVKLISIAPNELDLTIREVKKQ